MMPRRIVSLAAFTALAVACATTETDFRPGDAGAPDAEPPTFPTEKGACACSEDGHHVLCDGGAGSACGKGQRCFDAKCVDDACDAAQKKQSTDGCSFYTVVPDASGGKQGCYAVFLTNTSPRPSEVKLRIEGREVRGSKFVYVPKGSGKDITYEPAPDGRVPENGLAIAFIAGPSSFNSGDYKPCPVEPAVKHANSSPRDVGFSNAIALETSEPVVASDIYPYGGGDSYVTGASILLPVNAWGKEYVVATPPVADANFVDLVAVENTVLTLTPKQTPIGGEDILPPLAVGQSSTLEIRAGQTYHLFKYTDLTGLVVSGDRPFLAISGSRCWGNPCDAAHQQLPTVATLGWEYAAVGHRDRLPATPVSTPDCRASIGPESHRYRLVGVADGTMLQYAPLPPSGAPTTLAAGRDAWIDSKYPFVVKSQDQEHPFFVAELMSSCTAVDPCALNGCPGDPEFTTLVPTAQFLRDYLFFTDPTYPTTSLVVTRTRPVDGPFADVTLDCAGPLTGWKQIADRYEYARLDLVTDGVDQGKCQNGRHTMSSAGDFSVTIWGWGKDEVLSDGKIRNVTGATSYAFPASRGVKPINPVEGVVK